MHKPDCTQSGAHQDERPTTAILMPFFLFTEIHSFAYGKDFVPFSYRDVNFYAPLNLMKPKVILSLSRVSLRHACVYPEKTSQTAVLGNL